MISGSYGSMTFSRNRYGLYVRSRVVPTNPGTSYQQNVRAQLVYVSQQWQQLDPDDQADWATWAENNPIIDSLGQQQVLSGHAAYVMINTRLRLRGDALIDEPPLNPAPEPLTALSIDAAMTPSPAADLGFSTSPVGANDYLEVYAAKVNSPGISYVKNKYRLLSYNKAATSPLSILTELEARLGTISTGEIIHVKALISSAEGVPSEALVAHGSVGA